MDSAEDILGVLTGLVFVVMALSIPLVVILVRYRRQRRAMELYHSERLAAIERGMELPPFAPEFSGITAAYKSPRTALLPGLVWFFVGIAISGALLLAEQREGLVAGLIPTAIGLAYLVYYFVEERKKSLDGSV